MAPTKTVQVIHGDDYMVINESDFDPEKHRLFGLESVKEDQYFIVADVDGIKHFWDGDAFQPEPTEKLYSSDDSALSAINRTKAIKEYVDSGLVQNVRVEVA